MESLYGMYGNYNNKYKTKYQIQVDKSKDLKTQVESGGLAHQKKFYFLIKVIPDGIDTDAIAELLWDEFTLGKRHVGIVSIVRTDQSIVIEFERKMCFKFGIHSYIDNTIQLELVKKYEYEIEMHKLQAEKWKSKWGAALRGNQK